jgi:hypothetical protein
MALNELTGEPSPNTALQRTPPALPLAPLSFKTLGDWANRKGQVSLTVS